MSSVPIAQDVVPLEHRFTADRGEHFMPGVQAVVRMLLDQMRHDRRLGHKTAAFVSGYPGSPLGTLDSELLRCQALLDELGIVHQPGLNEELAATAVFGSQAATVSDGFEYDGVLGMWYGKAPGLDRAADAIRHGNMAGTGFLSGALVVVGDDPACKSSSLPSGSEGICRDLYLPVLQPANSSDVLELGRHAIEMSRYSGLWSALKVVTVVADGSARVDLDASRFVPVIPELDIDQRHRVGNRLHAPHTMELEEGIVERRLPRAREYGRANRLNFTTSEPTDAWLGVIVSGHTYLDFLDSLRVLGLDEGALANLGVRVLRIRMSYPIDDQLLRSFADGLDEVLVVEERKPFVEEQVRGALYGRPNAPVIAGKHRPDGTPLLKAWGTLDVLELARILAERLTARVDESRLDLRSLRPSRRAPIPISVAAERTAWFCSGCPHSTSTQVPPGSLVGTGIGCHALASRMDPERTGTVLSNTQMGGEGAQWVGAAPFVKEPHFFQNIGDGTLSHSGWLAIRFAVASGNNITYKLLYNSAVAMTGGQSPIGLRSVEDTIRGLQAEGVGRVIVTTDDPGRYRKARFGSGVEVWDRRRIIEAQSLLATSPGVTVLIHDQACAAEVRRQRRRGSVPPAAHRVVINHRVCEDCGDCGKKSACLSLHSIETPFGVKTTIHQDSCNFDYSCLEGDCPSFVIVETSKNASDGDALLLGGTVDGLSGASRIDDPQLPEADLEYVIRIPGVGGTGVVTVAQILARAASLDGFDVHGLDQTGLSQKAGPVVSDLRLSASRQDVPGRASRDGLDLLLVLDPLVATSAEHFDLLSSNRSVVVGTTTWTPPGSTIGVPLTAPVDSKALAATLDSAARSTHWMDSEALAIRYLGTAIPANLVVVGAAYQVGALPMRAAVIEEAIRHNGVAVDLNLAAFRLGRRFIADPASFQDVGVKEVPALESGLVELIDSITENDEVRALLVHRAADLVGYKDRRYARRFLEVVGAVALVMPGLVSEVAVNLHKLMAYKDEYEVARLHLLPDVESETRKLESAGARSWVLLHPPVLRALGLKRKLRLGRSTRPILKVLRAGRRIRGTVLDPFGYTKMRKLERQLVEEYIDMVFELRDIGVDADDERTRELVSLPQLIRGYEDVKLMNVERYHRRMSELANELRIGERRAG